MVSLIVALFTICAAVLHHQAYGDKVKVWAGDGQSAKALATPQSFTISPWEAYQIADESDRIAIKHSSVCYRDAQYYYIADPSGKSRSAETAVRYGLKINGTSGKIEN